MPPLYVPCHVFVDAHLIIAGVTLFITVRHLYLAYGGMRRDLNLPIVIMSLLVAGEAVTGPGRYLSATVGASVFWWNLSWAFTIPCISAMTWFVRAFSRSRGLRIPLLLTLANLLTLAVHLWLPYGLGFHAMPATEIRRFPWGETINVLVGDPHPVFLAQVTVISSMGYLAASCVPLWRRREARRDAWLLTIALAPLILVVYPHGWLVHRGWVKPPTYYAFGLAATVAVISYGVVSDTIRSRLHEGVSKERRRFSLLDNFSLLAIGCNRAGLIEYVNPYLLRATGFDEADLLGKSLEVLVSGAERPALHAVFQAAIAGDPKSGLQTRVITRSAESRQVIWSTTLLRGPDDQIEGMLSVGSDITDRIQAERSRDRAIQELAD